MRRTQHQPLEATVTSSPNADWGEELAQPSQTCTAAIIEPNQVLPLGQHGYLPGHRILPSRRRPRCIRVLVSIHLGWPNITPHYLPLHVRQLSKKKAHMNQRPAQSPGMPEVRRIQISRTLPPTDMDLPIRHPLHHPRIILTIRHPSISHHDAPHGRCTDFPP